MCSEEPKRRDRRMVLSWPSRRNASENPFQELLTDGLIAEGWDVREFSLLRALTTPRAIWHWHWVDGQLTGREGSSALLRYALLRGLLMWARLLGCKLVVTAHNLGPHDIPKNGLVARWLTALDAATAAVHYLSESSRAEVATARPGLASKPYVVTRHGHYRPVLPTPLPDKLEARAELGVTADARVLVTFGKLRRYKGPLQLLELFGEADLPGVHLIVAGQPESGEVADRLEAWPSSENLTLITGLLSQRDLAVTVCAADVVLLPYRNVLNSGSALFALSAHRPLVAPSIGSLLELRTQVTEGWMTTYDGELDYEVLKAAAHVALPVGELDLADFDWSIVAQLLGSLYERLS